MEEKKNNIAEEKEIDILELLNKLWQGRIFFCKVLTVSFIVSIIVAFSIPKEYTTVVILTPESHTGSLASNMGSLAALAGINLENGLGVDVLALPDLYPDVIQSTPFLRGIFNIQVKDSKQNIDTTLYTYLSEYQSTAWWNYILSVPSLLRSLFQASDELMIGGEANNRIISEEEMLVIDNMQKRLTVASDKKTGLTTIEITMQSPEISAYLADTITSYLQSYIINYRTQKARKDLHYAEKLYIEAQQSYYKAQKDLATFIDGNINVVSAKYRINQEKLQNEANLTFSIYNQMAQQLQMTKIKVQDTTPVFTVIQPAVQPLIPTKPSKKLIVIGFLFFGAVVASVWILRTEILSSLFGNK